MSDSIDTGNATKAEKTAAKAKAKAADENYTHELRQVEDQWLGKDAPRMPDGKVERGHGSLWAGLTPERKKHHAALEKAIAAEVKHSHAEAAAHTAGMELSAAQKHVAETWVA